MMADGIDLPKRIAIEIPEMEFVRQRGVSERVISQMVYEVTDSVLRWLHWRQSPVVAPLFDYVYIYLGSRDEAALLFDQLYLGVQQQVCEIMPARFVSFFGVERVLYDRVIITHLRVNETMPLPDDFLEKAKSITRHSKGYYNLC